MENKITTIKIEKQTKSRLDKLKEHERETYNQTIKKLLYLINIFRRNSEHGNKILNTIDKTIKRKQQVYQNVPKEKTKEVESK